MPDFFENFFHSVREDGSIVVTGLKSAVGVTELVIPEGVTEIAPRAFHGFNFDKVVFPESLRAIGDWAFFSCQSLRELRFPARLQSIGEHAFSLCKGVKELVLGDGVKTIGAYAFSDCFLLTKVFIPASVTVMKTRVFENCFNLSCVYCAHRERPEGWDESWRGAFESFEVCWGAKCIEAERDCYEETVVRTLDDFEYTVYADGSFEIYGLKNENTTTAIVPDGAVEVCLYRHKNLRKIVLPDSVFALGAHAFAGATKLKEVILPKRLLYIGEFAFHNCRALTDFTIPSTVRTVGGSAFTGCTALKELVCDSPYAFDFYGRWVDKEFTRVRYTREREALPTLENPVPVVDGGVGRCVDWEAERIKIPEGAKVLGAGSFKDCKKLQKITLPASLEKIAWNAFWNLGVSEFAVAAGNPVFCAKNGVLYTKDRKKIVSVPRECALLEIPECVEEIGAGAFAYWKGKTLVFPKTLKRVGRSAFYYSDLEKINLPQGVEVLDETAFYSYNIKEARLPATLVSVGFNAFTDSAKIFCKAESKPEGWHEHWNGENGKAYFNGTKK